MNNLINNIKKILFQNYPLKISFDKINTLSHFYIKSYNNNNFLTINFDINGLILKLIVKNYQIIKVITTEIIDWNKYILLYVSLLNKSWNPCINKTKFLYYNNTFYYFIFKYI